MPAPGKSTRRYAGLAFVGVSALIVAVLLTANRQPQYGGKTARYWFRLYAEHRSPVAVEAFHAMGADAVAYLTDRLSESPSLTKSNLTSLVSPEFARENYRDALLRQRAAAYLLGEIGPAARSSQALLEDLTNSTFQPLRTSARAALMKIRRDPVESLRLALEDTSDAEAWFLEALIALELGPYASETVPAAMRALHDTNILAQTMAMSLLAAVSARPSECISAIVPFLKSEDVTLRQWAMGTLSDLGTNAVAAMDAIRYAQDDPDPVVRRRAKEALATLSSSVASRHSKPGTVEPTAAHEPPRRVSDSDVPDARTLDSPPAHAASGDR
jgi:hypothetical protein